MLSWCVFCQAWEVSSLCPLKPGPNLWALGVTRVASVQAKLFPLPEAVELRNSCLNQKPFFCQGENQLGVKEPTLLCVCQETSSVMSELQMEVAKYLFALQCHLNLILGLWFWDYKRCIDVFISWLFCFNGLIECAFTTVPQHVLAPIIITAFSLLAWINNSLMNGINFLMICYT